MQGKAVFLARNCPARGHRVEGALQASLSRFGFADPLGPATAPADLGACEKTGENGLSKANPPGRAGKWYD